MKISIRSCHSHEPRSVKQSQESRAFLICIAIETRTFQRRGNTAIRPQLDAPEPPSSITRSNKVEANGKVANARRTCRFGARRFLCKKIKIKKKCVIQDEATFSSLSTQTRAGATFHELAVFFHGRAATVFHCAIRLGCRAKKGLRAAGRRSAMLSLFRPASAVSTSRAAFRGHGIGDPRRRVEPPALHVKTI